MSNRSICQIPPKQKLGHTRATTGVRSNTNIPHAATTNRADTSERAVFAGDTVCKSGTWRVATDAEAGEVGR